MAAGGRSVPTAARLAGILNPGDALGWLAGHPDGEPGATGRPPGSKGSPPMRTLRAAAAHARYLLSSLAGVAFGTSFN